jgi:pyruvate formate lyase activating enzyme
MFKENVCTRCGGCYAPCDHTECAPFGRCIKRCPNNCLSVAGREYEADELTEKLASYGDFLRINGGGITFSGGEPLLQADFVCEVANGLRSRGIHTAVQTSGYSDIDTFARLTESIDFVMMDIKIADSDTHRKYTGVDNRLILDNYRFLRDSGKPYVIRVPLIPGITDTEENLCGISDIIQDSPCELLRYNKLAGAKYSMLGMEYPLDDKDNRDVDVNIFKNGKIC